MKLFPGRSVTLRLTLLFAMVSTCVLLALGMMVGSLVERHFAEMDADLLEGKIELVENALADSATETLGARLDAALVGHHGLAVVVWDAEGNMRYKTEGANFPPELRQSGGLAAVKQALQWTDQKGHRFRGLSRTLAVPTSGGAASVVAISTDLTVHEHFMHSFNQALWAGVALAAAASGLLGWAVARRGLAPLRDIARNAAEITADRLDRRLPTESIPAELAEVVRTLNEMFARLEDSFRRLSDFSSDLAHELRTPVSNLLTQTQVTLSKARTADEYREVLTSNAEEFERLSRTIADMLFLAKSDNNLVVPDRGPVDLRAEADGLFEFFEALAEENGVRFSVEGNATVTGDRLMLRRAMSNLLSNAFRHTPPGGHVEIHVGKTGDGQATVSVANTGAAIPEEYLPRIFDRFFRADPSRHRDSEGSGLGLAITRSIMRAHGGDASVHAVNGKTVFELRMPA